MKKSIQVFVSSFGSECNPEKVKSRRLKSLLTAYKSIVDEISIADLNQEMVLAYSQSLQLDETARDATRAELAERLGLVKSGNEEVILP